MIVTSDRETSILLIFIVSLFLYSFLYMFPVNNIFANVPLNYNIMYNSENNNLYVVDEYNKDIFDKDDNLMRHYIKVIDGNTYKLIGNITITDNDVIEYLNSDIKEGLIYATKWDSRGMFGYIDIINTTTNKVIDTIDFGRELSAIGKPVYNTCNNNIYVPEYLYEILIVNTTTNEHNGEEIVFEDSFNDENRGIAYNPITDSIYSIFHSSNNGDRINIIDCNNNITSFSLNGQLNFSNLDFFSPPYGIDFNPSNNHLYALDSLLNKTILKVIDVNTYKIIENITIGGESMIGFNYNPSNNYIYSLEKLENKTILGIIDGNTYQSITNVTLNGSSMGGFSFNLKNGNVFLNTKLGEKNLIYEIDGKSNKEIRRILY